MIKHRIYKKFYRKKCDVVLFDLNTIVFMRFGFNINNSLHHFINSILLLIVSSGTNLFNFSFGFLINLTKALIWLSRVLINSKKKGVNNSRQLSWNISNFTCATKFWYSVFFCALSSSISLAASERASFKRWTRSRYFLIKYNSCYINPTYIAWPFEQSWKLHAQHPKEC